MRSPKNIPSWIGTGGLPRSARPTAAATLVSLDRTRSGDASFHPKFAGVYSAPLPRPRERVRLRIFVDACSVETFVNDGQVVLTALAFPGRESDGIELTASSEAESVIALQAWRLSSKLSK